MLDKRTSLHIYCETNKRSRMYYPDHVYICDNCKAAFGHHVLWCPNCPGRCRRLVYTSYDELFKETGESYEWGETLLWDNYRQFNERKFDAERLKGIVEPCMVYFWVEDYRQNNFNKLISEYVYKEYQQGEPADTNIKNGKWSILEYKFLLPSWVRAHEMVYRHYKDENNGQKVYIFYHYRKRMREI